MYCPCVTDGSENVTGLDLSDFPALADRSRREGTGNPTPVLNPLTGRAPYGKPLDCRKCLIIFLTRITDSTYHQHWKWISAENHQMSFIMLAKLLLHCTRQTIIADCTILFVFVFFFAVTLSSSSWHGDKAIN